MWLLVGCITFVQATPRNLYEQLCEVNPAWHSNHSTAQKLGLLQAPTIQNEQDLLVFHIQTLAKIFSTRSTHHLSKLQQHQRQKHLRVLKQYWQLRDCPRNYYLPYRNPVFIDHEGRYCAVGYLMLKSGQKKFCEAVQKNSNFIKIREIKSRTFAQWQAQSGLSLDELAWIQPYYTPQVRYEEITELGASRTPRFLDSLRALKLNRPNDDYLYGQEFNQMFMGNQAVDVQKAMQKLRFKGKPEWKALEKQQMEVIKITLFKGQLYAMANNRMSVGYEKARFAIFRWNKQGKWEKFMAQKPIYAFFTYKGQLYAGGGYETFTKEMEEGVSVEKPQYTHSYLIKLQGNTWKKIDREYGGIVFGIYQGGGKSYLATVVNTSIGSKRAPIPPKSKTNK